MMYLGTIFGVQLGTVMNEYVLMASLMMLVAYAFYKTLDKAIQMRKHELLNPGDISSGRLSLQVREPLMSDHHVGPMSPLQDKTDFKLSERLQAIMRSEATHFTKSRVTQ